MSNRLLQIAPLRDAMEERLRGSYVSVGSDYHVTQLLKSPRIYQLEKRHKEYFQSLPITDEEILSIRKAHLGDGVHNNFEKLLRQYSNKHPNKGYLLERRLCKEVLGKRITGRFDGYLNGMIFDWKTTSVWKRVYEQYEEFEQQLNIYAYILSQDLPVTALSVIAAYTDWDQWKAKQGGNYPALPYEQIPITLWTPEKQKEFLEERVQLHIDNEDKADNELILCTDKDMWIKETKYAVKAPKKARALRVLDSMKDAERYIENKTDDSGETDLYVETRHGERTRCENWCRANLFCSQYKEFKENAKG